MQSSGNNTAASSGDVIMPSTGNEMMPSVDRFAMLVMHPITFVILQMTLQQ